MSTDTLEIEMRFNGLLKKFVDESPSYRCPITRLTINTDSNNEWLKPTEVNGEIISWLGRAIIESNITAMELMNAAHALLEKGK